MEIGHVAINRMARGQKFRKIHFEKNIFKSYFQNFTKIFQSKSQLFSTITYMNMSQGHIVFRLGQLFFFASTINFSLLFFKITDFDILQMLNTFCSCMNNLEEYI